MISLVKIIFVTGTLYLYNDVCSAQNLQVTTPLGPMIGSTMTTRLGKTINAFRGIRYAQPPINDLRFKDPQPILKWDADVYNATDDGAECPQPSLGVPTSEDCLFLNVYSTKLPSRGSNPKRPVIIHIHAGAFYSVTGHSAWAGPQYFMDQDIVLVTLNYRLATLGFLSIGKEAPGNYGLKDQVMAMKWVKKNIASFGGDPNSVTLFGYSAGSWSINLHMVSPMSRGLFHRAICGSGSSLGHWPLPRHGQLTIAKKQARFVGCPEEPIKDMFECLKKASAEDLGNSFSKFSEFGYNPILRWSPVIEEDFGQERFLPEHPIKTIESGNFYKVPMINGITSEEFFQMAFTLVQNSSMLNEFSENFEELAPLTLIYERNTPKSREVSRTVRKFYLGDGPLNNASLGALAKLFSDSIVGFPANRATKLIAEKSTKPVYYYRFSYAGRYSHFTMPGTNQTVGPVHHDDLIYLFYISKLFPFFQSSDPESKMVDKLTSLWANFAKTGNPTPIPQAKFDNVIWPTYNCKTEKFLDIGDHMVIDNKMFADRYKVWERLYPISEYLH